MKLSRQSRRKAGPNCSPEPGWPRPGGRGETPPSAEGGRGGGCHEEPRESGGKRRPTPSQRTTPVCVSRDAVMRSRESGVRALSGWPSGQLEREVCAGRTLFWLQAQATILRHAGLSCPAAHSRAARPLGRAPASAGAQEGPSRRTFTPLCADGGLCSSPGLCRRQLRQCPQGLRCPGQEWNGVRPCSGPCQACLYLVCLFLIAEATYFDSLLQFDALVEPVVDQPPSRPEPNLINEDFAPVMSKDRTFSTWDIAALWIGLVVCVPSYTLVGR